MDEPRVTVVVPTRGRLDSLRRCVSALQRQSLGDALAIVVVQDGGDQPGLEDMRGLRVVRQERRGPGAARNHGVSLARAPIVCFTDDDCEPLPDWAERLERRIASRCRRRDRSHPQRRSPLGDRCSFAARRVASRRTLRRGWVDRFRLFQQLRVPD